MVHPCGWKGQSAAALLLGGDLTSDVALGEVGGTVGGHGELDLLGVGEVGDRAVTEDLRVVQEGFPLRVLGPVALHEGVVHSGVHRATERIVLVEPEVDQTHVLGAVGHHLLQRVDGVLDRRGEGADAATLLCLPSLRFRSQPGVQRKRRLGDGRSVGTGRVVEVVLVDTEGVRVPKLQPDEGAHEVVLGTGLVVVPRETEGGLAVDLEELGFGGELVLGREHLLVGRE